MLIKARQRKKIISGNQLWWVVPIGVECASRKASAMVEISLYEPLCISV